jgi:hypothetical protein
MAVNRAKPACCPMIVSEVDIDGRFSKGRQTHSPAASTVCAANHKEVIIKRW